jgi:hypothetical protein
MTGLPGWIRYSFFPGLRGRNPSILGFNPPYVKRSSAPPYPHTTKYIPQEQTALSTDQNTALPGFSSLYDPWGMAVLTPEEELNFMKVEAEQLEDQLYAVEKRIKELEEKQ